MCRSEISGIMGERIGDLEVSASEMLSGEIIRFLEIEFGSKWVL